MRRGAASCRAVATRARSSRQRAVTVPWRSRCPELASRLLVPLSASLSAVWASGVQASSVHGFWVSSVRCRASGVQASSVHAFGCPGVRCPGVRVQGPRPSHPRCPHRERLGRLPGSGLARPSRGWPCMARPRVDPAAASEAHRLRRQARRLADQGTWSSSRMPAGRLGSTDREQVRTASSDLGVRGRCRRGRSTTGLNRNMVATLSGRCAGEARLAQHPAGHQGSMGRGPRP
jgi:hypothetical protein